MFTLGEMKNPSTNRHASQRTPTAVVDQSPLDEWLARLEPLNEFMNDG
jgi:hypothetical protein